MTAAASHRGSLWGDLCPLLPSLPISRASLALPLCRQLAPALPSSSLVLPGRQRCTARGCWALRPPARPQRAGRMSQGLFFSFPQLHSSVGAKKGRFLCWPVSRPGSGRALPPCLVPTIKVPRAKRFRCSPPCPCPLSSAGKKGNKMLIWSPALQPCLMARRPLARWGSLWAPGEGRRSCCHPDRRQGRLLTADAGWCGRRCGGGFSHLSEPSGSGEALPAGDSPRGGPDWPAALPQTVSCTPARGWVTSVLFIMAAP